MLDIFARVLLATVFLGAVAGKLTDFAAFRGSVIALAPRLPAVPVAVAVVAGEVVTVALLLIPVTVAAGYGLAALLLATFCVAIALAVHNGQKVRCQCFGAGGTTLGPQHLLRNCLLLAVAGVGVLAGDSATAQAVLIAATAGALAGLAVVRWADLVFLTGRSS